MIKIKYPATIYLVPDQDMERKNKDVDIVVERTTIKISKLQKLCCECWELQDRIETLENALNHSIKAAESRKPKQMVKIRKKKKKNKEHVKASYKAVTIKKLLLQESLHEGTKNIYIYWHLADSK